MGTEIIGKSKSIEYSTPDSIVKPLIQEFDLTRDVCASKNNFKLNKYWTKEDNALLKNWEENCWMNPPFDRNIGKWALKAHSETIKYGGYKVCLLPVRSNTVWWSKICLDAEIRFINGEVNFNNEKRGLWLPMCIMIFGNNSFKGTFDVFNYRKARQANERKIITMSILRK